MHILPSCWGLPAGCLPAVAELSRWAVLAVAGRAGAFGGTRFFRLRRVSTCARTVQRQTLTNRCNSWCILLSTGLL